MHVCACVYNEARHALVLCRSTLTHLGAEMRERRVAALALAWRAPGPHTHSGRALPAPRTMPRTSPLGTLLTLRVHRVWHRRVYGSNGHRCQPDGPLLHAFLRRGPTLGELATNTKKQQRARDEALALQLTTPFSGKPVLTSSGPHMAHSHTVHLPLGALLMTCTMCGAGGSPTRTAPSA